MYKSNFGKRVRIARQRAHLTSDKLAEICNCTPVSIRQIESGTRLPSLPKLISLCNALEASPNDLLGADLTFDTEAKRDSAFHALDDRLAQIMIWIRRLPIEKGSFVCSVTETILAHIGEL